MRRLRWLCSAAILVAWSCAANAVVIHFDTDPFEGSTALTTPGRQIVGGEPSITFDIASDVFSFESSAFNLAEPLTFVNDVIGNVPAAGADFIVLRTFDNDADPASPFGAGIAANLLADRITTPGAGLFIYFNSGLDLARLVYSPDLSADDVDLKILARLTNLSGAAGRAAFASFTASNFSSGDSVTQVPEPPSIVLLAVGLVALLPRLRRTARLPLR
jgi:hypothetical protein